MWHSKYYNIAYDNIFSSEVAAAILIVFSVSSLALAISTISWTEFTGGYSKLNTSPSIILNLLSEQLLHLMMPWLLPRELKRIFPVSVWFQSHIINLWVCMSYLAEIFALKLSVCTLSHGISHHRSPPPFSSIKLISTFCISSFFIHWVRLDSSKKKSNLVQIRGNRFIGQCLAAGLETVRGWEEECPLV